MPEPVPPRGVVPSTPLAQYPVVHPEPLQSQGHAQRSRRPPHGQPRQLGAHMEQVGQGVVEDGEAEAERSFAEIITLFNNESTVVYPVYTLGLCRGTV